MAFSYARSLLLAAPAVLCAATAQAADPQAYTVAIASSGDALADAAIKASSSLISLRQAPVGPFALISRAEADVTRFATALDSEGYYDASVVIMVQGRRLDDPGLPMWLDAVPKGNAVKLQVQVQKGPRYSIGQVVLNGAIPAAVRQGFALQPGQPARAAPVLAAGTALLASLQDQGYALATVPPPVAFLRPASKTLDISYTVTTGPRVDIGPITLAGLRAVKPDLVRRRLLLQQGQLYNPDRIEAARQDLASLPVFSAVRVQAANTIDAHGELPVTFDFTERLRHVVALGASYSTDLGASLSASWTDRNLFGGAEQLTLSAAATELGGSDAQQPGYNLAATLLKPDWLRRDQSLQFDALAVREYLDTYDRTAVTLDALVDRKLSRTLTISAGISGTEEHVTQEEVGREYTFVGIPLGVKYDTTGSLLSPIHGIRASATITPTESFGGTDGSQTYVLLAATGSTYINLAAPGRSVLALRATLGASEGASQFGLPPDQRFYGGGSGTIRGYKYQFVGPQFADHVPEGGTSLDAGTVEFRQRFGRSYGVALFADAGQVGTSGLPFEGAMRAGVGIGARYYTSIGPVRVDVGTPLSKVPGSGRIEAYIGIGEAF